MFADISAALASDQLIVIVLASHVAGDGDTLPNNAARNARRSEYAKYMLSAQLLAQYDAQADTSSL